MHETITLPDDPAEAVRLMKERSAETPVLLFKASPFCPVSAMAEGELLDWLDGRDEGGPLLLAQIDVVRRKELARGVTDALEIRHESPQAVLFNGGEVRWYGSHGQLHAERFREMVP